VRLSSSCIETFTGAALAGAADACGVVVAAFAMPVNPKPNSVLVTIAVRGIRFLNDFLFIIKLLAAPSHFITEVNEPTGFYLKKSTWNWEYTAVTIAE
jgi:hypothetical protein